MGRLNPKQWLVVALAAYAGLVAIPLAVQGGNPEWFVHFGSDPERSSVLPLAREVYGPDVALPYKDGHDGQYFWVLARDPLLLDPAEATTYLDRPAYRSQRILLPLLAAPGAVLGAHGTIWMMLLVNGVAVGLGTWAAAAIGQILRARWWAPLAFLVNPMVLVGVLLLTADALALAAALTGVLLHLRRRPVPAGIAFAVAVLAKELMLLVPLAIGLGWILRHGARGLRGAAALVVPGMAAGGVWALYARSRLGWPPSQIEELTFPPFAGFVDAWRATWAPFGDWPQLVLAGAYVLIAAAVIHQWWVRRSSMLWAALPWAVGLPFYTAQVVSLGTNTTRALGPAITFLAISAFGDDPPDQDPLASAGEAPEPALDSDWIQPQAAST